MKRMLVLAGAALALVPASDGALSGKPRLQLVREAPLALRGTSFEPAERVRVNVVTGGRYTRRVTSGANGGFVVRFRVDFDRCNGLSALARGDEGSRARLKIPERLCRPRE